MTSKNQSGSTSKKTSKSKSSGEQEDFHRGVLDAVDRPMHVVDDKLRIVFLNRAFKKWCRALKINIKDIIGQKVSEAFPFLNPLVMSEYRQVLKSATAVITREDQIIPGGIKIYTETMKIPLINNGRVTHVITNIRDMTERITYNEELRASEEKYRLLVENVKSHISIIDRKGVILFMNRSGARLFGLKPEEIAGMTQWDLFPKEMADIQTKNIRRVIKGGREFREEARTLIGKNIHWFDVNILPYRDLRGKVVAAMVIATDITEQKKNMEALQASEEQYRVLIENVQADIVLIDREGTFLYANDSSANSFGMKPGEIVGKNQKDLFPRGAAERQLENIRRVIDEGVDFREEVETELGGKKRWVDVNIQPFQNVDGQIKSALIIAIDVTHRREADQALRDSEERFRRQFEYLPIPTYTWEFNNDDFQLVECNMAAYAITEGKIRDFLGSMASKMYSHMPEVLNDMFHCLRNKTSLTREITYNFVSTGKQKYLIVHYVYTPPHHVVVHTEDITERKSAEDALKRAHDELESRVKQRTIELAEANEALEVERELLNQKNIALREVLDQIEEGKKQMASDIQSNIDRIVLPILKSLESKTVPAGKTYLGLLRESLSEITSPLMSTLELKSARLTPRELEICNMVRSGLSSKDIAETLNTSVQTVLKQRAGIRKKLGLANSQTNLVSYLKSLE